MTKEQELIEDILQIAHQENGVNIFHIQEALRIILKDVDNMVEECRVKSEEKELDINDTEIEEYY